MDGKVVLSKILAVVKSGVDSTPPPRLQAGMKLSWVNSTIEAISTQLYRAIFDELPCVTGYEFGTLSGREMLSDCCLRIVANFIPR